jgi:hypothetical protein
VCIGIVFYLISSFSPLFCLDVLLKDLDKVIKGLLIVTERQELFGALDISHVTMKFRSAVDVP